MGKSLDIFKVFVLILILGYGGYFGWKYYTDQNEGISGGKSYPGSASSGEDGDPDATPVALTPWEMQNQELSIVSARIFDPISKGAVNVESTLKNLWNSAKVDYQNGDLTEQQANVITGFIAVLKELADERNLYVGQLKELSNSKPSSIDSGITAEEKKIFAEKELNRRWNDWKKVNQAKVRPYIKAFSQG